MDCRQYKDAWRRGLKAEDEFGEILLDKKVMFRPATLNEQYKHIDYVLKTGTTIDVKSNKKDPTEVWLEYKNVRGGDGWLVANNLDLVAFERVDDFIIVKRVELLKLSNELCNIDNIVENKSNVLYNGYTRKKWGRDDLMTKIKMSDLEQIKNVIWKKI